MSAVESKWVKAFALHPANPSLNTWYHIPGGPQTTGPTTEAIHPVSQVSPGVDRSQIP